MDKFFNSVNLNYKDILIQFIGVLGDENGFSSYILGIKKSPISVSDQAGCFSFGHKKAPHFHVRLSWVMCNLGLNIQIALVPRVVSTILYFKIFLTEITHLKPV